MLPALQGWVALHHKAQSGKQGSNHTVHALCVRYTALCRGTFLCRVGPGLGAMPMHMSLLMGWRGWGLGVEGTRIVMGCSPPARACRPKRIMVTPVVGAAAEQPLVASATWACHTYAARPPPCGPPATPMSIAPPSVLCAGFVQGALQPLEPS